MKNFNAINRVMGNADNEHKPMHISMQYFAEKADGDADDNGGNNGDDDQGDGDQDDKGSGGKGKKSEKTFTQAELDEAIKLRLKRERDKANKQEQAKDDKQGDKGTDDKSKDDANAKKLTSLEEKVLCYDHDISKEYVKEAIALAKAYVDEDTDMDEALEKVTKKFPQFVKASTKSKEDDQDDDEEETDNKGSWGQRQKGNSKKTDAVEAAFLKRNPGMKLD